MMESRSWPCTGHPQSHTLCLTALSKHCSSSVLWPLPWGARSSALPLGKDFFPDIPPKLPPHNFRPFPGALSLSPQRRAQCLPLLVPSSCNRSGVSARSLLTSLPLKALQNLRSPPGKARESPRIVHGLEPSSRLPAMQAGAAGLCDKQVRAMCCVVTAEAASGWAPHLSMSSG